MAPLVITPATPTLTVSGGPFVYTGTAQPAVATAVGVDGMTAVAGSFAITYNGSSSVPVNAGSYTVVANFTEQQPELQQRRYG